MKTNRDYSNEGVKGRCGSYHFGCTPPQSDVRLLPKHMNKPLWWRIKEWFK